MEKTLFSWIFGRNGPLNKLGRSLSTPGLPYLEMTNLYTFSVAVLSVLTA